MASTSNFVKREAISDSFGTGNRVYLPNGDIYEKRDVQYVKLPMGEIITPAELPGGTASIQVYRKPGQHWTGRLWFPKLPTSQEGQASNYALQRKVIDAFCARNEKIFQGSSSTHSAALISGSNHLLALRIPTSYRDSRDTEEMYLHAGGPGPCGEIARKEKITGTFLEERQALCRLAREYVDSNRQPNQPVTDILPFLGALGGGFIAALGAHPSYGATAAVAGIGAILGTAAKKTVNWYYDKKPDTIYDALMEQAKFPIEELSDFLVDTAAKLEEAEKQYGEIKVEPHIAPTVLAEAIPKKNALREKVAKLEAILETAPHAFYFMANLPQHLPGFSVKHTTKEYETLLALFGMTLGYREPERIEDMNEFEAKQRDTKIPHITSIPRLFETPENQPQQPLEITIQKENRKLDAKEITGCNGEYEILELLGEGAYGRWYKAKDKEGRTVAIKVPLEGKKEEFENKKIAKLKGIQHPNIVEVYEVADGENPHIVAEYVEGVDLRTLINTQRLPVEAATHIIAEISKGVQRAHKEDVAVLHNDIKPENVLITKDGKVKLVDFGASENLGEAVLSAGLKTRDVTGTADYAPPERLGTVEGKVGKQSDVYSIAKLGYELLTGSRAIDPRGMTKLNQDIPLGLADAINQALVVPPELRTKDTDTLLSQLAKFPQRELRLKVLTPDATEVKQVEIVVNSRDTQKVEMLPENGGKPRETANAKPITDAEWVETVSELRRPPIEEVVKIIRTMEGGKGYMDYSGCPAEPEPKQRRPDIEDTVRRETVRRLEAEAHTDWVPEEQEPKRKRVCE